MILSSVSYSQTAITDANFQTAINTCLSTNPVDGLCSDSEYGAMPDWDVSSVTDMSVAFNGRNDFNADISSWDVSMVTNMSYLFKNTTFNADISSWDVSSVTNMYQMFYLTTSFNQPIGSWDVSNVTDMSYMFYSASSFNQNISNWCVTNITSEPTEFSINSPLSESNTPVWGTCPNTPITDANFQEAIYTCLRSNPEDGMCTDSEYGAMPDWDVSQVTNMIYAFKDKYDFNGDISSWDVSSVTVFIGMFSAATSFNQDIGSWDVSNAGSMDEMFEIAGDFNQDISGWCVTYIASEPIDFSIYSPLIESNKPVWGTCPTAGVEDQNQLDISIYPNPTSDIVYIEGNYSQLKVVVYDILGKQLMNKSITNSIDISQLEKGVYILQLSDGVKLTTQRIIKN